jgi:FMN-dependent NADH-azoreductase
VTVLRIDASIQGPNSASSELADLAEAEWLAVRPETTFVRRHVGTDPLPADAWSLALQARWLPEDQHTEKQRQAVELATTLTEELRQAEAVILALPL